jgi:hypothetical protein
MRTSRYAPAAALGLEQIIADGDAETVPETDEVFEDPFYSSPA